MRTFEVTDRATARTVKVKASSWEEAALAAYRRLTGSRSKRLFAVRATGVPWSSGIFGVYRSVGDAATLLTDRGLLVHEAA